LRPILRKAAAWRTFQSCSAGIVRGSLCILGTVQLGVHIVGFGRPRAQLAVRRKCLSIPVMDSSSSETSGLGTPPTTISSILRLRQLRNSSQTYCERTRNCGRQQIEDLGGDPSFTFIHFTSRIQRVPSCLRHLSETGRNPRALRLPRPPTLQDRQHAGSSRNVSPARRALGASLRERLQAPG